MARTGVAATTRVDQSAPPAGASSAADDRAAALAAARRAADLLVRRYGARRVYLFGSLAGTGSVVFHPGSDIDLAVEGLPGEVFWKALAAVDAVMPPRHPADVSELESVRPYIKEAVLERGLLLAHSDSTTSDKTDGAVMEQPRWRRLAEEIEQELGRMGDLVVEAGPLAEPAFTPSSSLDLRAGGSILQNFYNGTERTFQRIARIVDEHVPSGDHWHRTLLAQMAAPYPDRRPPVISAVTREGFVRYLGFRHLFRNIYGPDLDWSSMVGLLQALGDTHRGLSAELGAFCAYLRRHPNGRETEAAESDCGEEHHA